MTINNQNKIASAINALGLDGVDAVGDDGSVCVQVKGDADRVTQVANLILKDIGDVATGDGVQTGGIFINGDDAGIHDDLFDVATHFSV